MTSGNVLGRWVLQQQKGWEKARGGGWVHPEGENSMAVSGLHSRKVLVGTGRAISAVFSINGK